jgi:hypothetical protein
MGNGWDGNRYFVSILGLLCLLTTEEGDLAFCGDFGEISTIRLFVVGRGAIPVLFGLFLGFLPWCVAHITPVGLEAVWLSFPELIVGGLAWRGRWGQMVRMCGSRRCAELHGVF